MPLRADCSAVIGFLFSVEGELFTQIKITRGLRWQPQNGYQASRTNAGDMKKPGNGVIELDITWGLLAAVEHESLVD